MIRRSTHFFRDIYEKRSILFELAKRDFQSQYMGSYLGFVWIYLQPLLFMALLVLVVTVGFRQGTTAGGVPFAVYLVTGLTAWLYFSENLNSSTTVIQQHAFLLKKVDFRVSIPAKRFHGLAQITARPVAQSAFFALHQGFSLGHGTALSPGRRR